ncbi:MAG: hypothetical protein Tsb0034_17230 [Ekhidna sp.]
MLKFLLKAISNALGFSKTEARGTLVLIFITLLALISSQFYIHHVKSQPLTLADSEELREWVKQVEASIEAKEYRDEEETIYLPRPNYANSGKVKNISEKKRISEPDTELKTATVIRDLNTATMDELQEVRGIGPAFSERIVKYRELLGGFYSMLQLSEVYGLTPETIQNIQKGFEIQSSPRPFQINNDSAKVLARHPYIDYDLAWVIINYRKQNGDLLSADDLKKIKAIDDSTFARLKPYLE